MSGFKRSRCGSCLFGIVIDWSDEDHPAVQRCDTCRYFVTDANAARALIGLLANVHDFTKRIKGESDAKTPS